MTECPDGESVSNVSGNLSVDASVFEHKVSKKHSFSCQAQFWVDYIVTALLSVLLASSSSENTHQDQAN